MLPIHEPSSRNSLRKNGYRCGIVASAPPAKRVPRPFICLYSIALRSRRTKADAEASRQLTPRLQRSASRCAQDWKTVQKFEQRRNRHRFVYIVAFIGRSLGVSEMMQADKMPLFVKKRRA